MKKISFLTVCAFALMFGAASCSTKTTNDNDSLDSTETVLNDSVDYLEADTLATDSVAL